MDHAGALGDGADGHGLAADGAGDRQLLLHRVGGHDGVGRGVGAVLGQGGSGSGHSLGNSVDIQLLANDAGGGHHEIAGLQTGGLGRQLTHLLGVLMAVGGAGIGVA